MKVNRWIYVPLVIWSLVVILPILWIIETSFKNAHGIYTGPNYVPWVQFQPTLSAWAAVLTGSNTLWLPLSNSLVVGILSTTVALAVGSAAAYGLSRFRYRIGRINNDNILMWVVSQRMMPPIVTGIAFFLILRTLGLLDTQVGLSLVYLGLNLPLAVWFMKNFFDQVPKDMEEAAQLDGATSTGILRHVVIPVSIPGLVGTFLLTFIFSWNEFLLASLLTFSKAVTLPLYIAAQQEMDATQWWNIAAISVVAIVPMIVLSWFVERGLISGLLSGSVQ
jgi:multiple sugar transport system permease protein